MLRLVSVVGITIAMVVGFVAISSQMRDDFDVRSKVVKGIDSMKALANQELHCDFIDTERDSDAEQTNPEDMVNQEDQNRMNNTTSAGDDSGIFSSIDYEFIEDNKIEVVAVFTAVKGSSGKLRISSGRKINIQCSCIDENISCQVAGSDINKKYIPSKISK